MMISLITAWIATVCAILTAFKYFAKKNKKMNRIFHNIHIPLGIFLIVAGLVHGLLAGNPLGTTLSQASFGNILFTWNMGTVCLIFAILLGITYVLRKILKKNWMRLHRVLTVMLVVAIVIHVCQMGITLPYAISDLGKETGISEVINSEDTANSEVTNIEDTSNSEVINSEDTANSEDINSEETDISEGNNDKETEDVTEDTETDNSNNLVTFSGATLKDGTYQGSADGYIGVITVSVVVRNGSVTDISIVEENDTPQFFERAKEIINTIINGQSLEVDGITGATYSSKGIQDAVYNALQNAVISGELKITNIQISNSHGHRR
ncbi:MAG: FMN-binding protein [Acutalibacteraceae bacterium]